MISSRARAVLAGVALVLLALMMTLMFRGPTFTTDGDGIDVDCGSLIATGWPSDGSYLQDKTYFGYRSFHTSGNAQLTNTQVIGFFQDCNERRDTYLTFLVILAIPFTILMTLVVMPARRPAAAWSGAA